MQGITDYVLQVTTTITATETIIGQQIPCGHYNTLTIFLDYTKGDEDGVFIAPYVYFEDGGDAYQYQTWTAAAGDKTSTSNRFSMTATGKYYATLDIRGIRFVEFRMDADGGTPTGTLAVNATMTEE